MKTDVHEDAAILDDLRSLDEVECCIPDCGREPVWIGIMTCCGHVGEPCCDEHKKVVDRHYGVAVCLTCKLAIIPAYVVKWRPL